VYWSECFLSISIFFLPLRQKAGNVMDGVSGFGKKRSSKGGKIIRSVEHCVDKTYTVHT
jgi:hypothetical protein